jgi:uncharacterized protein
VAVKAADEWVQKTPDMLPVLKQAGVVDSGGKGLFFILEGMLRHVYGESLETPLMSVQPISSMQMQDAMEDVEEGQDYEVVVDFMPTSDFDLHKFYDHLEGMGTSIQVGEGDGMYRMHIHVPLEKRYEPIDYIMGLGTITKVAMENLLAQMDDIQKSKASRIQFAAVEPGQIAVVVVSPGAGLSRIFASLGVAAVVEGGADHEPLHAGYFELVRKPAHRQDHHPAEQQEYRDGGQPGQGCDRQEGGGCAEPTIPQGLAAMLSLQPDGELDAVADKMIKALEPRPHRRDHRGNAFGGDRWASKWRRAR